MRETEIARVAADELSRQGYAIYHEVQAWNGGPRADLVAVRGRFLVVVEAKAKMGLALIGQARRWTDAANNCIVVTPSVRRGAADRILKDYGIGWWVVGEHGQLSVAVEPKLRRNRSEALSKVLRPEHRDESYAAAGSYGGGYYTPFRASVDALRGVVAREPGIALADAIKAIKHHYASDRSASGSLADLIQRGIIAGIRVEGRPMRLYPRSTS